MAELGFCDSGFRRTVFVGADQRTELLNNAGGRFLIQLLFINPVAKPRMTQSDRWKTRPATDRYWDYKDRLSKLIKAEDLPESYHLVFVMPMPKSWTAKKRKQLNDSPHRQKPDKDNLEKGFLDALFDDDSAIWDGRVSKIWGEEGAIFVLPIEPFTPKEIWQLKDDSGPLARSKSIPQKLMGHQGANARPV